MRVHPCIKALVEKYRGGRMRVFNFHKRYSSASDFNRAVNIGLKEIGAELGIEGLQFYDARHITFSYSVKTRNLQRLSA